MQYTGLKDKNGKEIYEGDIVFHDVDDYQKNNKDYEPDGMCGDVWDAGTAEVIYCAFGFHFKEIKCGEWRFNGPEGQEWRHDLIEVIGNIHENPELLIS